MLSCEEKENEIVTSFQKKVFKKMWAVFWQPFFLAAVLSKIRLLEASAEPFFPDGKEKKTVDHMVGLGVIVFIAFSLTKIYRNGCLWNDKQVFARRIYLQRAIV